MPLDKRVDSFAADWQAATARDAAILEQANPGVPGANVEEHRPFVAVRGNSSSKGGSQQVVDKRHIRANRFERYVMGRALRGVGCALRNRNEHVWSDSQAPAYMFSMEYAEHIDGRTVCLYGAVVDRLNRGVAWFRAESQRVAPDLPRKSRSGLVCHNGEILGHWGMRRSRYACDVASQVQRDKGSD